MDWTPLMWPTFAAELLAARASLDLSTEVGLALRADRHRLAMSQRKYAAHRGWSLATVIRLETAAGEMKLRHVVDALESTPFVLSLCHRPPDASEAAGQAPTDAPPRTDDPTRTDNPAPEPRTPPLDRPPEPVHPAFWPRAELIARVRGGGRRFAAHHVTEQVSYPPPWWWYAESSRAGTVPPDWYAPRFTRRDASAS